MNRPIPASPARRAMSAAALALVALASAAAPALAASDEPTVELAVGYYQPSFTTDVRLDSATFGQGSDIGLERELGVDDSAGAVRGEVGFRISERNRLVADYVAFDRSGNSTLHREVQFGDVVYAADADLSTRVKTRQASASWRFSFVRTDTVDLAVSLGASWLDLEAETSGVASAAVGGLPVGSTDIAEQGKASGPVPLAGLHGRWWLGDSLRLAADARYFDVNNFHGWSGSIVDYGARVEYFFTRNVGLGAGWLGTRLKADFEGSGSSGAGHLDYRLDGAELRAIFAF